ncbi:MAG: DNA polymerase III subunit alpha [Victivallales bacterium]|jgi:DNA polymerase-3 subunit alpha|nr:DNA polymerase III subunit alpha [Victivallales bacterium]
MPSDFVHLHLHTHYSLLDGACTAKGLVNLAKENEMTAMAITDHGYMGGVEEFHRTLSAAGINPIIGVEAYVAPGDRRDFDSNNPFNRGGFHLILLSENEQGYFNLCKMMSAANKDGFYYKPRIDKELLREYHDGLICSSACIASEISQYYLQGNEQRAIQALHEYLDIFGANNFFIELMDHGIAEERQCNRFLIEQARKNQLKLIATNDVHYMRQSDAEAHEIMLCVQTNAKLAEKHFKFSGPDYYFKTESEMREIFREVPEAITNTRLVAERCNIKFHYVPEVNHYPKFYMPDNRLADKNDLRELCCENMPYRYGFDPRKLDKLSDEQQKIIDRMDYELGVIEKTGFISYFFVVSDFIGYAKNSGIPVGPGRGSGAGSIVAYLSRITDIDPLRYQLFFERFLNPERISPPDFDIDFCEKRRGEVIEYVRNKYGFDSVAQICTYGLLKPKAVLKDVARVLGFDFDFGNRLTKLIPADPKITIDSAIKQSPELAQLIAEDPAVERIVNFGKVLEGLNRQAGIHAAGVIIGDQRLDNLVPLSRSASDSMVVSFPAHPCEAQGLLKMDFLGLRTLTIIKNALDMIKKNHGVDLDMMKIPLDDGKTFEMLQRGDTVAVFQLESSGMQNLCRSFGVETIEHIVALIAIYRPGPMQFIGDFVARKKGIAPIIYDHPLMEDCLKETYGIMLYQEQIMQVVRILAGFTLGGADILRRAIGKKKENELAEQQEKFVRGCKETNNIDEALANQIWEKIKLFAGYGFNKSHSAAYGIICYQTAYLKANYPLEFMAAVLTSELESADKIAFFINSCKAMNIKVLPPDVNSSGISFSVDSDCIRFGLGAIKGVGEIAASKIIESRETDGKFESFLDFCERCGTEVNSRMLEYLTRAGALDSLGLRRSQILAIAEPMMNFASSRAKDKAAGQGSLFDLLDSSDAGMDELNSVPIPDIPEFDQTEILKSEKELLGFYVTGHPLDPYATLVKAFSSCPIRNIESLPDNSQIRIAGMVNSYSEKFSKKSGKKFGVMLLEDLDSSVECMLYERVLSELAKQEIALAPGLPVLASVTVNKRDESEKARVAVDKLILLPEATNGLTEELHIHLYADELKPGMAKEIAEACFRIPGKTKIVICLVGADDSVTFIEANREKITVTKPLLDELDRILTPGHWRLKAAAYNPPMRRAWNRDKEQAQSSAAPPPVG